MFLAISIGGFLFFFANINDIPVEISPISLFLVSFNFISFSSIFVSYLHDLIDLRIDSLIIFFTNNIDIFYH